MSLLAVGSQAPDFTVLTTTGESLTLSQFHGKKNVVLFFYPEDDTPGCTVESCAFRDDSAEFEKMDTVILGVSLDDVASHQRFTKKFNLNFLLLADTDGAICKAYGVEVKDHWPKRITYVIGKDGSIINVYPAVAVQVHSREILELLSVRA